MWSNTKVILRNGNCRVSQLSGILKVHTSSSENQHVAALEADTVNVKQYKEIPGPSAFELVKSSLPGGKYYKKDFSDFLSSFKQKYGDISKIPGVFGKSDIILVYDPEDFKTVFQTQGQYPIRRGIETIFHYRTKVRKDFYEGVIGFADQGKSWWDFRQKVNAVMMKPQITRKYVPSVDEVTQDFVKRLHSLRDKNMETPSNFYAELKMWALESIAQITLDTRLGIFDSTNNKNMHSLINDLEVFFDLTYRLNFQLSLWKYFPTAAYRKLTESTDNMYKVIQHYVNIGIRKIKDNTDDEENEGVLKKLLEIDPKVATVMAMDALFAGVDSTSTATFAVLYVLAKNPEKQDKLRQELMKILPEKTSPLTVENMSNMPYLRACIKEALRLYPVTFGNIRSTGQDLVLKGYHIPKDTRILMGNQLTQMEDKYFDKPYEFKPERWIRPPDSKITCPVNATSHPFSYLPFGFGVRMCVGRRFAEMEIESLVSRLVRNYYIEWRYPDPTIKSLTINMPVSDLKFRLTELKE